MRKGFVILSLTILIVTTMVFPIFAERHPPPSSNDSIFEDQTE